MDFEAIVIGSGFGGAVAALRLGEAGVRTLVLERGMRWPIRSSQDTFAPSTNPDGRSVWLKTSWGGRVVDRYAGVRDVVEADGMTITQGAGVGGGSLVYAATLLPDARCFAVCSVMPSTTTRWIACTTREYARCCRHRRFQMHRVQGDTSCRR